MLLSVVDWIFDVFQRLMKWRFLPVWYDIEGKEAKRDGARGRCQVTGRMACNGIVELQSPTLFFFLPEVPMNDFIRPHIPVSSHYKPKAKKLMGYEFKYLALKFKYVFPM